MSPLDVIALPGHPSMFARRIAVEAWQAAGSPPANSAGRLYAAQKALWDGWRQRLPGFNPADNPDDESEALAHVRFVAFDIDPTAERIRRLTAAGLHRPYPYEPWHWELPNVHSYALVRAIPATASLDATRIVIPTIKEQPMSLSITHVIRKGVGEFIMYASATGVSLSVELSTATADRKAFELRVAQTLATAAGFDAGYKIPTLDDSSSGGWYLRNQLALRVAGMPAGYPLAPDKPFNALTYYRGDAPAAVAPALPKTFTFTGTATAQ